MKEIIYNEDNLLDKDITNEIKRAKILIENSNDEILLAYCHNNYFFLGGHVETGETYNECIIRELAEEAEVQTDVKVDEPFLIIKYFTKDYPKLGMNTRYINAYYAVHLDIIPDLTKINLTEDELNGNFELRYLKKELVLSTLEESLNVASRINVVKDTIDALEIYLSN